MFILKTPLSKSDIIHLHAGDEVLLSGFIYTARDQAHKKIVELMKKKQKLPFVLKGQIIYYCGPTHTPTGKIIGSCGPTTSARMDEFAPTLLASGVLGMIGKGNRSLAVKAAMRKYKVIYFLAPSGCGALLAKKVLSKKLICFKELGPEAVYRLEVKDFPLIVGVDCQGHSFYRD